MKSMAFIIPYFGKLPDSFPLYLRSCEANPTVDFFLFTDARRNFPYPSNVTVMYSEFEDIVSMFRKKFDFDIALDKPYKLCDFKPTYGEVFSNYLEGYNYWGFCDVDMIWGNIRKFLPDEKLEKYSRIYTRGHCSIFKNTEEVNSLYRKLPCSGHQSYRDVFQSESIWAYDEWAGHAGGGTSQIMLENNIPMYNERDFADITVGKGKFSINGTDENDVSFVWDNGRLYSCDRRANTLTEYVYVHFQKRPIINKNAIEFAAEEKLYFTAPCYAGDASILRKKWIVDRILFEIKYDFKRLQKRLQR